MVAHDRPNGIVTPGLNNSSEKLKIIKMPERLDGLTVLDIGAWDGFFSFEAERRGAKRVLATDYFCWFVGCWKSKDGFMLARDALKSKVEDKNIDVLELSPDTVGVFDLVLFLGVLYHMKYAILALEKVASVTGKQLIVETYVDMLDVKRPTAAVYPFDELNSDPTNWWGFNPAAVEGLLKAVGFKKVEIVSGPEEHQLSKNMMVFHAWK